MVKNESSESRGATGSNEGGIRLVGGRKPINSRYAGTTHPSGVKFSKEGFPDFTPHAKIEVNVSGMNGVYAHDAILANRAAGLDHTPEGYTWNHVEDGVKMQLVPSKIHRDTRHTGGSATIRHGEGASQNEN
jgi:hypothetical protein